MHEELEVDWLKLGKRIVALNQLGIRIEQDSGHRWLMIDAEADNLPAFLHPAVVTTKQYGSYISALDYIDELLVANNSPTLLEKFEDIDYNQDLGVIFGQGVQ